jgi:hypothetical protein
MELVADLPDGRKMPAIRAVLEALRAEFKPGVAGVPLWLHRLLDAFGAVKPDVGVTTGAAERAHVERLPQGNPESWRWPPDGGS